MLKTYEPAFRMRKLGLTISVEAEPYSDFLAIDPVGLEKVSNIDPSADTVGFLDRLLRAGGWERGKVTPQTVVKKFPELQLSDFQNTGKLDHFLDGLILLDNYLKRVGISPFKGEHMEEIEHEIFGGDEMDE